MAKTAKKTGAKRASGKKKASPRKAAQAPVTIAGVAVPKTLRKPAAKAKRLLDDYPAISDAVAAGMLVVVAVLLDNKDGKTKNVLKVAATAAGAKLMSDAKGAAATMMKGAISAGGAPAERGRPAKSQA